MPAICQSELLADYLVGELPAEQTTAVEAHLDDCSTCRAEIDRLAAERSWWLEARDFLSSDDAIAAEFPSDSGIERPAGDPLPEAMRRDLAVRYLAPSDDPRYIGRIGPYEVVGVVGSGGMGVVFKGLDPALNRYVAIKVVAPHLAGSSAARQRFLREAQAAAAIVHDNVLPIHGVAEHLGLPYLVMPYLRGPSLQKRIDEHGALAVDELLRIATQAAAGLAAAHAQGLVHRDIKPANILLEEGIERVRISDFGLARAADDASLTYTGVLPGTPHYMSPEQARGKRIDHRSDLFSLGCVMYAMATGRPPFRAETSYGVLREVEDATPRSIRTQNPDVPRWLEEIIFKLLAKNADDRFPSATAVAQDLEHRLAQWQLSPREASVGFRSAKARWIATIAGTGILVAIAFAFFTSDGSREEAPPNKPSQAAAAPAHSPVMRPRGEVKRNMSWDSGLETELQLLRQGMENLEASQQSSWPTVGSR